MKRFGPDDENGGASQRKASVRSQLVQALSNDSLVVRLSSNEGLREEFLRQLYMRGVTPKHQTTDVNTRVQYTDEMEKAFHNLNNQSQRMETQERKSPREVSLNATPEDPASNSTEKGEHMSSIAAELSAHDVRLELPYS